VLIELPNWAREKEMFVKKLAKNETEKVVLGVAAGAGGCGSCRDRSRREGKKLARIRIKKGSKVF